MTQEDKELLLKDLCARLPYYPKCEIIDKLRVVNNEKDSSYTSTLFPKHIELFSCHNNFIIRPYLRPMSSMTEEESAELSNIISEWFDKELFYLTEKPFLEYALSKINYSISPLLFDWLNAHHIDYRGLIPKDLAIAVTEKNNPYKK